MREVAALWVRIMTVQEAATETSGGTSCQWTSGKERRGRPPATGPMTEMPCAAKSHIALAVDAATNTNNEPGTVGANRRISNIVARLSEVTSSVCGWVCGRAWQTLQSWRP